MRGKEGRPFQYVAREGVTAIEINTKLYMPYKKAGNVNYRLTNNTFYLQKFFYIVLDLNINIISFMIITRDFA